MNVELTLVYSKTPIELRKPKWEKTVGQLVHEVAVGSSVTIARTVPDPEPYFATSSVTELIFNSDGTLILSTLNSVYRLRTLKAENKKALP